MSLVMQLMVISHKSSRSLLTTKSPNPSSHNNKARRVKTKLLYALSNRQSSVSSLAYRYHQTDPQIHLEMVRIQSTQLQQQPRLRGATHSIHREVLTETKILINHAFHRPLVLLLRAFVHPRRPRLLRVCYRASHVGNAFAKIKSTEGSLAL